MTSKRLARLLTTCVVALAVLAPRPVAALAQFGVLGRSVAHGAIGYNVVADGDSITFGANLSAGQPWPDQALVLLGGISTMTNKGVSGQTLANMESDASTDIDPLISHAAGMINVVVAFGGTNDIYFNADADYTAATTISRLTTYANNRRSAGWRVVVVTMLPRGDFGGGSTSTLPADRKTHHEARRQAYNTWLRANYATNSWTLADVAADNRIGDDGDELDTNVYQGDKVHPTATGEGYIAGTIVTAIQTIH